MGVFNLVYIERRMFVTMYFTDYVAADSKIERRLS